VAQQLAILLPAAESQHRSQTPRNTRNCPPTRLFVPASAAVASPADLRTPRVQVTNRVSGPDQVFTGRVWSARGDYLPHSSGKGRLPQSLAVRVRRQPARGFEERERPLTLQACITRTSARLQRDLACSGRWASGAASASRR
jgi:hypothetical protein